MCVVIYAGGAKQGKSDCEEDYTIINCTKTAVEEKALWC